MARVKTTSQFVSHLVGEALLRGDAVHPYQGSVVDFSNDCEQPVLLEMLGDAISDHPSEAYRLRRNADLKVRCRKCSRCLAARSNEWAARAINELQFWPRSWFGTLTVDPERQFLAECVASRRVRRAQLREFEELTPDEQFRERVRALSPEITTFLKRVRSASGARLRYLLVCEAHKSGLPHWHLLMHEVAGSVRKRVLDASWLLGYSQWRVVDTTSNKGPAFYAAKYLSKSALARVRASVEYGRPISALGSLPGATPAPQGEINPAVSVKGEGTNLSDTLC